MSGDLQSKHFPVVLQGVLTSKFCALVGAAIFLARFIAESRSEQTLFIPTMKITFFGPCAMHETRLELPSIFTSIPSLVIAFALYFAIGIGLFNWLPGAANYLTTLASVFVAIGVTLATYGKKKEAGK